MCSVVGRLREMDREILEDYHRAGPYPEVIAACQTMLKGGVL